MDQLVVVHVAAGSTARWNHVPPRTEWPVPGDLNLFAVFEWLGRRNPERYVGSLKEVWMSERNDPTSRVVPHMEVPLWELTPVLGKHIWFLLSHPEPESSAHSTTCPVSGQEMPISDAFAVLMTANPVVLPDSRPTSSPHHDALMQALSKTAFSNIAGSQKSLPLIIEVRAAYAEAVWMISGQSQKFRKRHIPLPNIALSLADRAHRQIQERSSKMGSHALSEEAMRRVANRLKEAIFFLHNSLITEDDKNTVIIMKGEEQRYRLYRARSILGDIETMFQVFLKDAAAFADALQKYADYLKNASGEQQVYRDSIRVNGSHVLLHSEIFSGVLLGKSKLPPVSQLFQDQLRTMNDFDVIRFPSHQHPAEYGYSFPVAWVRANKRSNVGWVSVIIKLPEDIIPNDPRLHLALQRGQAELTPLRLTETSISSIAHQHQFKHVAVRSILKSAGCQVQQSNQKTKIVDARYLRSLQGVEAAAACHGSEDGSDLTLLREHLQRSKYETFFRRLAEYLESGCIGAGLRRRPNESEYALTSNIKQLKVAIAERFSLTPSQVPSSEYIRLHFRPPMVSTLTASRYYGLYPIRFLTMARSIHQEHVDLHYVNALQLLFRCYADRIKAATFSCDDKASILCGAPGVPEAPVVRPQPTMQLLSNPLLVSDHDYESASKITASVIFQMTHPLTEPYRGIPFVNLKSKTFHPSSAYRHAVELAALLGTTQPAPPIFLLTDGGPDHNVTHMSVKLSLIWLWYTTKSPLLVAIRLCPGNSYRNPAERLMSRLNMALSTLVLERTLGSENFETQLSKARTLELLRKQGEDDPEFISHFMQSLQAPLMAVNDAFQRTTWKGEAIRSKILQDEVSFNHTDLPLSLPSEVKRVEHHPSFRHFCRNHVFSSAYSFQIRKCGMASCLICADQDPVDPLPFLPLPTPIEFGLDGVPIQFQKADEVISSVFTVTGLGTEAPSVFPKKEKSIPRAFSANRALKIFLCHECNRPRLLFPAAEHFSEADKTHLLETARTDYRCGDSGQGVLTYINCCVDRIEIQLYRIVRSPSAHQYPSLTGTTLSRFNPPCIHCGTAVPSPSDWADQTFFPQCPQCDADNVSNTLRRNTHVAKKSLSTSQVFQTLPSKAADLAPVTQLSISTSSPSFDAFQSQPSCSSEECFVLQDIPPKQESSSSSTAISSNFALINDEEMNLFCSQMTSDQVAICSTFFYTYCSMQRTEALIRAWNRSGLARSSSKVLLPCAVSSHWLLCVISFAHRKIEEVSFLDSAQEYLAQRRDEIASPIRNFLQKWQPSIDLPATNWVQSPQQSNDTDCGVFIMSFIRHLVLHPDLPLGNFSGFEILERDMIPQRSREPVMCFSSLVFLPRKRTRSSLLNDEFGRLAQSSLPPS